MIYLFDEYDKVTEDALPLLVNLLPPARRERALRYRFREGQISCAVAYLLFLYGFRTEYGGSGTPEWEIGENEKPYLADYDNIHFNVSHCNRAAVCMMSILPVGIDIQDVRDIKERYIRAICSPEEQRRIMMAPNAQMEFCKIWTQKEALSKYTGEGVFRDTAKISMNNAPLDVMAATVAVKKDIFMTACGRIEDANFTMKRVSLEMLLSL